MNALDEIDAIRAAYVALSPLDPSARERALRFIEARLSCEAGQVTAAIPAQSANRATERVFRKVCAASGVTKRQLLGKTRKAEVCRARFAVMLALRHGGMSLPKIGQELGGRDHSTVFHGIKRAEAMRHSPKFAPLLNAVRSELEA